MDERKKQDEQKKPFVGAMSVNGIKIEKFSTNGKRVRR